MTDGVQAATSDVPEEITRVWPDDPVAAFARSAWDMVGFRPYGYIILAGLRGLGYTGPTGLCWKCEGKAFIARGCVDGVFLPAEPCKECNGTGIEALGGEHE